MLLAILGYYLLICRLLHCIIDSLLNVFVVIIDAANSIRCSVENCELSGDGQ